MIITLSRQHGACGRLLAETLAEALGYRVVGKHLILQVAKEAGVSVAEAAKNDERADSSLAYMVKKAFAGGGMAPTYAGAVPAMGAFTAAHLESEAFEILDEDRYAELSRVSLTEAAEAENLVIVGRGGQAILADCPDSIHVRAIGPEASRAAFLVKTRGVAEEEALETVRKVDAQRERYVKRHFDTDPTDPANYDLVLNTSRMNVRTAADAVMSVLRARSQVVGEVTDTEAMPAAVHGGA